MYSPGDGGRFSGLGGLGGSGNGEPKDSADFDVETNGFRLELGDGDLDLAVAVDLDRGAKDMLSDVIL